MNVYREAPRQPELLVVARATEITALDRRTGVARWSTPLVDTGAGLVSLVVSEHQVVVSASAALVVAMEYETGEVRWRAPTNRAGPASMVLEDGLLMICKSGVVDCFDMAGQRLWTSHLPVGNIAPRWAIGFPGNVSGA